jgi:hypothetical protein
VSLKWGPPLSATNSRPSSSNATVMMLPFGPGPDSPYHVTLRIREFSKTET